MSKSQNATKKPSINVMVDNALKKLNDPSGSSLVAIKKFLVETYSVDLDKTNDSIKKYIKDSVGSGKLVQTKGTGLSGSFKLSRGTSKSAEPKMTKAKATTTNKKKEGPIPLKKPSATMGEKKKASVTKNSATAKKPLAKKAAKSPAKKKTKESVTSVSAAKKKTQSKNRDGDCWSCPYDDVSKKTKAKPKAKTGVGAMKPKKKAQPKNNDCWSCPYDDDSMYSDTDDDCAPCKLPKKSMAKTKAKVGVGAKKKAQPKNKDWGMCNLDDGDCWSCPYDDDSMYSDTDDDCTPCKLPKKSMAKTKAKVGVGAKKKAQPKNKDWGMCNLGDGDCWSCPYDDDSMYSDTDDDCIPCKLPKKSMAKTKGKSGARAIFKRKSVATLFKSARPKIGRK